MLDVGPRRSKLQYWNLHLGTKVRVFNQNRVIADHLSPFMSLRGLKTTVALRRDCMSESVEDPAWLAGVRDPRHSYEARTRYKCEFARATLPFLTLSPATASDCCCLIGLRDLAPVRDRLRPILIHHSSGTSSLRASLSTTRRTAFRSCSSPESRASPISRSLRALGGLTGCGCGLVRDVNVLTSGCDASGS